MLIKTSFDFIEKLFLPSQGLFELGDLIALGKEFRSELCGGEAKKADADEDQESRQHPACFRDRGDTPWRSNRISAGTGS